MAYGDPNAPSNDEAGKMGSSERGNRGGGGQRNKTVRSGILGTAATPGARDFLKKGAQGALTLAGKKPTSKMVFAGETEAEAEARRAAGGQGQRPEDFTPAPAAAAAPAVSTQQGGAGRQLNVGGIAIPRGDRIGKRNTQSGLSIPGF